MKRYTIRCPAERVEYVDILAESADGCAIRVTKQAGGGQTVTEQRMPRHLFNLCVATGYLAPAAPAPEPAAQQTAAKDTPPHGA